MIVIDIVSKWSACRVRISRRFQLIQWIRISDYLYLDFIKANPRISTVHDVRDCNENAETISWNTYSQMSTRWKWERKSAMRLVVCVAHLSNGCHWYRAENHPYAASRRNKIRKERSVIKTYSMAMRQQSDVIAVRRHAKCQRPTAPSNCQQRMLSCD